MSALSKADFASQARLALQNLYDFVYLQKLPLTSLLSAPNGTLDQGVRKLRAEILEAIERLNPPGTMPSRAKERRPTRCFMVTMCKASPRRNWPKNSPSASVSCGASTPAPLKPCSICSGKSWVRSWM